MPASRSARFRTSHDAPVAQPRARAARRRAGSRRSGDDAAHRWRHGAQRPVLRRRPRREVGRSPAQQSRQGAHRAPRDLTRSRDPQPPAERRRPRRCQGLDRSPSSSWTTWPSSCPSRPGPSSRRSIAPPCAITSSPTSIQQFSPRANQTQDRLDLTRGSRSSRKEIPLMMRGMYSAISGLRNHQIMLDVTANDLANVNTVGFKASRTSFRDSLAQMQRSGASATTGSAGAKSAQIGLGVQLGSIDNLMTNGAFQSTGSPYDVAITGTGWFRVSNSAPTAGATATDPDTFGSGSTFEYTRAGQLHPERSGRARHAGRVARRGQGRRPHHGRPLDDRHRHQGPRWLDRRLDQRRRCRDLHALRRRQPRHGRLPVAVRVPERVGPGSQLGQPLEGDRQLRRPRRRHARASTASARPWAASSR